MRCRALLKEKARQSMRLRNPCLDRLEGISQTSLLAKVLLCRATEPPISHILPRLPERLHATQQLVTVHLLDLLALKTLARNFCNRSELLMRVIYSVPTAPQQARSNGYPSISELFCVLNVAVFIDLSGRTSRKCDHLPSTPSLLLRISLSFSCSSVTGSVILSGKQL